MKGWFEQGVSNREMALRLAVSEATIRRVLRQAGLHREIQPEPERFLDQAGPTPAAAATIAAPTAVAPTTEPAPVAAAAPAARVTAAVVPAQEAIVREAQAWVPVGQRLTVLRDDGRQTTIVTNRNDLSAVEVVRGLFRRWRQEHYFKYMDAEFALDALVEYGVEDVSEEATRLNPARKSVAKKRQQAQAEVALLRAELGAEVTANREQQRPTMRGFKVAQAELRQRLSM